MGKIILIISTQYPGYGGAATNAYALIKYLRENGYHTFGIFLEQNKVDVDPDKIGNIFRFEYYPFKYNHTFRIMNYRKMLDGILNGEPSLILCKNYFAPICAKQLYPKIPNIYLISGLDNILDRCGNLSINQIYLQNIKIPQNENEIKALKHTTIAIANSPMTLSIFLNCYPNFKNKIHPEPIDTSQYLVNVNNELMEKKYDLMIASSILTRPEKNNIFLADLLKNAVLKKYSKVIIGQNNKIFEGLTNVSMYGLLPHATLIRLMKQTKILLYPSLFDSNPNTVREAIQNKCLVLISNNIGYYENFPPYSVCENFDHVEWMTKIVYLVEHYDDLIDKYNIDFPSDNILKLINII